jgi:hypothetical protein
MCMRASARMRVFVRPIPWDRPRRFPRDVAPEEPPLGDAAVGWSPKTGKCAIGGAAATADEATEDSASEE